MVYLRTGPGAASQISLMVLWVMSRTFSSPAGGRGTDGNVKRNIICIHVLITSAMTHFRCILAYTYKWLPAWSEARWLPPRAERTGRGYRRCWAIISAAGYPLYPLQLSATARQCGKCKWHSVTFGWIIFHFHLTSAKVLFDLKDLTPHEQMMTFPWRGELSTNPLLCDY